MEGKILNYSISLALCFLMVIPLRAQNGIKFREPPKAAVLAAAARILVRTACSGGPYHFRKGAVVPAFLRQNSPDGPDGPHRGDKIKKC